MLPGAPTLHEHEDLIRALMAQDQRQYLQQQRRPPAYSQATAPADVLDVPAAVRRRLALWLPGGAHWAPPVGSARAG